MKISKKLCLLGVTAAMTLGVLAGCGSGSGGDSAKDDKVLNIWGMGEEVKQLSKMTDKFTDETGIEVKIQSIPWSNAHDKLLTAVASKSGPDVLQMGTTWMPEFQKAGALADMSKYIEKYDNLKAENFYHGSVETTKFDDKYYGIPWAAETRVLFYRTDVLEKVGYKEAPKTWEELEDAAKKLAARGDDKYGINIDSKEQTLGFMFARQNGSPLLEDGKPVFNKKPFVDAVSYLNDFIQKGYSPKEDLGLDVSQTFSGDDAMVPMFISGPWMAKTVKDTVKDVDGKWAIATLPKKENNISSMGGSNLTIFEYSKKKDDAAKFIEFMARPENQLEWMKLTDALPTALKAWEDDSLKSDPVYSVFNEQLQNSEPMPLISEFEEIAQNYLKHFEQIYLGGANVQKEMDAFNQESETTLNK